MPHPIRLRGPWRARLGDGSHLRFTWPWREPPAGEVALRRGFQRPPNLHGCRVVLVIEGPAPEKIELNGRLLAAAAQTDVTKLLQPRNELALTAQPPLPHEVRLEIYEPGE